MNETRSSGISGANPGSWKTLRVWPAYLALPLLLLVLVGFTAQAGGDFQRQMLDSRVGTFESLTGLLAFLAAVASVVVLFQPGLRGNMKVRAWVLVYLCAMIYFCGEDLNWGQYYFGWDAPEFFQERNREREINIHNISPWFNQKPRIVVELWFLVAGILVPLGWNWPRRILSSWVPDILWPDRRLLPISAIVVLVKVPKSLHSEGLASAFALPDIRYSEVQELFFACGMLLYALLLYQRVREQRSGATTIHKQAPR